MSVARHMGRLLGSLVPLVADSEDSVIRLSANAAVAIRVEDER